MRTKLREGQTEYNAELVKMDAQQKRNRKAIRRVYLDNKSDQMNPAWNQTTNEN